MLILLFVLAAVAIAFWAFFKWDGDGPIHDCRTPDERKRGLTRRGLRIRSKDDSRFYR